MTLSQALDLLLRGQSHSAGEGSVPSSYSPARLIQMNDKKLEYGNDFFASEITAC